ncbi:MAG: PRC-barrel domain-containing protein [Solirubrobacteraceae bacterium]
MSDSFTAVSGRKVVSQKSAEELGDVAHIVIDVKRRKVASLIVGKGRKALVLDWDQVSGLGPDAVMVADESALHAPRDDHENAAADGKLELIGKRALNDVGNDLGELSDVRFDPKTGIIESLVLGEREEAAASLLGAGSYAAIFQTSAQ